MSPSSVLQEKHQKIAAQWEKVADFFYVTGEIMAPIAQIPWVGLIANPIMNGLWGAWYGACYIAFHYNSDLKYNGNKHADRYYRIQSTFLKVSYWVGGIGTVAALLSLIPPLWPFTLPVLLPIIALSTLASSALWATSMAVNLYRQTQAERDTEYPWRITQYSLTVLYSLVTVIVTALVLTALFSPVGWAVGAAAMTLAVTGAAVSLGLFALAKVCEWQADKKRQVQVKARRREIEMSELPVISIIKEEAMPPFARAFLPEFKKKLQDNLAKPRSLAQTSLKDSEEAPKGKGSEKPPILR